VKVLFLYFNIQLSPIRHYPFGIGALSAFVKQRGHDTQVLYLNKKMEPDPFIAALSVADPDIIAISAVSHQWQFVKEYAGLIKARCPVPIVCGGIHATFMPEEVIAEESIDMLCMGEGEPSFGELLDRLAAGKDLLGTPNFWIKDRQGKVHKTGVAPVIEDLDGLSYVDRGIVPFQTFIDESKTEPVFMTSRGCPYRCSYCSNSALRDLYRGKGRYLRRRSPENVIQEIREVRARYDFHTLNFYDECFTGDRDWLMRFGDLYEKAFAYPFGCFVRPGTIDREMFGRLRKAGLTIIYLGIESGNETLRKKVLNREISDEMIIQTCREAKEAGVQIWTFNMVGIPGETVETIDQAMALNRRINPNFACVFIFQPLPGTRLFDACRRKNYIKHFQYHKFIDDPVLNLPTISHDELMASYRKFQDLSRQMRMAHERNGDGVFLVDL